MGVVRKCGYCSKCDVWVCCCERWLKGCWRRYRLAKHRVGHRSLGESRRKD